jgi:hypothetical protein
MSGLTPARAMRVHDPSVVATHGVALWSAGQRAMWCCRPRSKPTGRGRSPGHRSRLPRRARPAVPRDLHRGRDHFDPDHRSVSFRDRCPRLQSNRSLHQIESSFGHRAAPFIRRIRYCSWEDASRKSTASEIGSGRSAFDEPDKRIARIRLSDKISRLHPRHVVPKPRQAYETEVPVRHVTPPARLPSRRSRQS